MPDVILHHYGASPFAEKIRAILGYKGFAWRSVDIPMVMPKPDLTALTGGYRKTPVLQIGCDVYCDTTLIARVLDALSPERPVYRPEQDGMAVPAGRWLDHHLFFSVIAQLFDLIARLEASLDFPDEGYHFIERGETARRVGCVVERLDRLLAGARRGRLIREGASVVVVGRPNVGKSSIFNALVGADRAIVTEIAGTTRDLVSERVDVDGLAVTFVDTAGYRDAADVVEREGVARAMRARDVADVLVVVLDRSEPVTSDDEQLLADSASQCRIVVANKSDLPARCSVAALQLQLSPSRDIVAGNGSETGEPVGHDLIAVSAKTGAGLDDLRRAIVRELTGAESLRDAADISNMRHVTLLEHARASLVRAQSAAMHDEAPEEFVLADLQEARARFDEIVGTRTSEDVLRHIFEKFCIGK